MMYDYVIIGAGIVGLSTAWQLQQRNPGKKILLIDKEQHVAAHQSGHNSGVIHAGVYYAPGSLKARFCQQGLLDTLAFCRQHGVRVEQCGKLLVATDDIELRRMQTLFERCQQNRIAVQLWDGDQLRQHEANITGRGAIRVNDTGVVDYTAVCSVMAHNFQSLGGRLQLSTEVTALSETSRCIQIDTRSHAIEAKFLINCAGLMADRVADMLGIEADFRIIPFRGEYYQLRPALNQWVKQLIYPIPDPELPFLGVHLTRTIDGRVTVGPNAVLGFKREGYSKWSFSGKDSWDMFRFAGFWRLAARQCSTASRELCSSWFKAAYLKRVQKYSPTLQLSDLQPAPCGVRAQAVTRDGTLVHDFLFVSSQRSLHVCNAPSPAATSAIPIGKYLCDKL